MEWTANNAFQTAKDLDSKSIMELAVITPIAEPVDRGLSSAENLNAAPSAKPRRKSMTSLYLKFFETSPDGKTRRCKFCKQSYSMATATGNLGRHLNHRHPGYDRQQGGDVLQPNTQLFVPSTATRKLQSMTKFSHIDLDNLNWLLMKWFVGGSFPLLTVDDESLTNCLKFLNPSIKIWPMNHLQTIIYDVFRSMQNDIKRHLELVISRISITLDFWTSYDQVCYMSVTAHWIDDNWVSHKVVLDISRTAYSVIDVNHNLLKILKAFDLENRILSCTIDNNQSKMKDDLDVGKLSFCSIPCAARMLDLIINDALKLIKPMMSRIREFVLELNVSSDIAEDFRQIMTDYQDESFHLPLNASTRWSGDYTILDLVRKAYGAIDAIVHKYEDRLGFRNILLTTSERNVMNIMHTFLEPFDKTTTNICASKSLTIGLVLFFVDHITEMITMCQDGRGTPEWLKSGADCMAQKAGSYSRQVQNLYAYVAAVLDPRIKGELLPENMNGESFLEEARSHFLGTYASHTPALPNGIFSGIHDNDSSSSVSFAEEIARKKRRGCINSATDELTQFLSEPPAAIDTDVFKWWRANNTRYPRLSVMARDYLAIQATSVAPEEVFTSKGDELEQQRLCLPHNFAQVILCIRSWMKTGFNLKYRNTEIDFEKLLQSSASSSEKRL